MQEPIIPPLFQTISKAESPLSFLETKRSAGPIRFIISTTEADERGRSFSWERKVMERCAIGGVGGVIRSPGTAGGSQGSETVYYK